MNKSSKHYHHIIWDWNGTLFNDVELCAGIMNLLLTQESLPNISIKKYKEIFTFPVVDYYRIAGHTFEKTTFEILGKQFMNEYESSKTDCQLFSGTEKLLSDLKSKNIHQHLLSAYEQKSLNKILKQYKIDSYFDNVVGLDNIYASGKLHLAKKLAVSISSNGRAGNILLIGDTIHDFEVAREINSDCILLSHGHQDKERLLTLGIPVVNNFDELKNLLKEIII
jgi:phosphoglycolate phosphatase